MNFSIRKTLVLLFAAFVFAKTATDFIYCHGKIGYDFRLRYNEIQCLKSGHDPFEIWSGESASSAFHRYDALPTGESSLPIHAYSPWEYTYLYPLSFLTLPTASYVFYWMNLVSVLSISLLAFSFGFSFRKRWFDGVFTAACVFSCMSIEWALWAQNFGPIIASLLFLMGWLLKTKRGFLAGICWALIMTKPQIGTLLFIPLLLQRQYKTIFVAVSVCLLATLPPAYLADTSPFSMIMCIGEIGKPYSNGTLFIPHPFFGIFTALISKDLLLAISALIGIGLCSLFSWWIREEKDWNLLLSPSLICATAWSYCIPSDRSVYMIPLLVISGKILQNRSWKASKWYGILILLLSSFSIMYFHAKCSTTWFYSLTGPLATGKAGQCVFAVALIGSFLAVVGSGIWFYRISSKQNIH